MSQICFISERYGDLGGEGRILKARKQSRGMLA
ncbi:hypothetical protein TNCV_146311, partial [Trichonephila clavipes]